jgi:hypothetical protein
MKSLVAIEPKKIASNCYKNLKPMMINFWDMESRARRNNNLDPVQHIGEIQSCRVNRLGKIMPYHSSKNTIEG